MTKKTSENELISRNFFVRDGFAVDKKGNKVERWLCNACNTSRTRLSNSGWSNLIQHLQAAHPNYMREYQDSRSPEKITAYLDTKSEKIHAWLDLIVHEELPFSFVEKERVRRYSKMPPICSNTLMKYLRDVTERVEEKIKMEMKHTKIGLLFDGWSENSVHFIGVFACYEVDGNSKYPLLAMAPLLSVDA